MLCALPPPTTPEGTKGGKGARDLDEEDEPACIMASPAAAAVRRRSRAARGRGIGGL